MTYFRGKRVGPGDDPTKASPMSWIFRLLPYVTLIVFFFIGTTMYTNDRSHYQVGEYAGLLLFSISLILFTLLLRSDFKGGK